MLRRNKITVQLVLILGVIMLAITALVITENYQSDQGEGEGEVAAVADREQNLQNQCEPGGPCGIDNDQQTTSHNGWTFDGTARIDTDSPYFGSGGPGKDGIPALDNPNFVSASATRFDDDELIIGVTHNGEAKAYPYAILNWHEIVNDEIGGVPVAVTYCPLCETNPVFIREVNGEETTFGVSGLLWNSCLVMYDRATESLWIQPWGVSVHGQAQDEQLQQIIAHRTTLGEWKAQHPHTQVLSDKTGHIRDYRFYPYGDYYTSENLIFEVENQQALTTHPKEIQQIVFVEESGDRSRNTYSGDSYAVAQNEVRGQGELTFTLQGEVVTARWDNDLNTIRFYKNTVEIPSMAIFSFIDAAFFK